MQYSRAMNILSGQSSLAQKVFDSVPMQEYWSIGQICNEMNRKERHSVSKGEITGCLRSLVDAGLVSEAGILTFRSNVKPPLSLKEQKEVTAPAPKAPAPKVSFMDRAFTMADNLRKTAEQLEQLGMDVDSALKEAGQGDKKFQELQATLKGLLGNG